MARTARYTVAEVRAALIKCNGLIFLTADELGCTPATVINYMHRHPTLRELVQARRGRRVDIGEAKLDTAVLAGEAWAVQFLLRTQGKDRGYVDRTEQRQVSDEEVNRGIVAELERMGLRGPDGVADETPDDTDPEAAGAEDFAEPDPVGGDPPPPPADDV